jgi:hypothetical protein
MPSAACWRTTIRCLRGRERYEEPAAATPALVAGCRGAGEPIRLRVDYEASRTWLGSSSAGAGLPVPASPRSTACGCRWRAGGAWADSASGVQPGEPTGPGVGGAGRADAEARALQPAMKRSLSLSSSWAGRLGSRPTGTASDRFTRWLDGFETAWPCNLEHSLRFWVGRGYRLAFDSWAAGGPAR